MSDLEKHEVVQACETLEELATCIESFADENDNIQGRSRSFLATNMAIICRNFNGYLANDLTKEFGIR